jgi:hypothetical protein
MKDTIKLIEIDPTWMAKTGGYAKDMTLRDYFAGLAMQTMTHRGEANVWMVARQAYALADAMLAERNL